MFLVNELSTMLPRYLLSRYTVGSQRVTHHFIHRALQQKRWYQERFNKDILPKRRAAIPGVI